MRKICLIACVSLLMGSLVTSAGPTLAADCTKGMLWPFVRAAGDCLTDGEIAAGQKGAYNGPMIHRGGLLFAVVGPQLVCADAATGEVRWRERTGEGTLVGFGEHLLWLGQSSGELRIVRASPEGYAERLKAQVFRPGVTSVTGPSYADGRLYVRNLREMAAFALTR